LYEQQLETADALEQEEIQSRIVIKKQRRQKYKAIQDQLSKSNQNQISTTDVDAKGIILNTMQWK